MYKSRYKTVSRRGFGKRKAKNFFSLFVKIGLPIALLVGFFSLARADFLQIKDFEINGGRDVNKEDIKKLGFDFISGEKFFIPNSNIILFDKDKFVLEALSKFTRLKEVEVNKSIFNGKIEINILEREGKFLWCASSSDCFIMTDNGLVFERAATTTSIVFAGQPVFYGILEGNPIMQNFASAEVMKNYESFLEVSKTSGIQVYSIKAESEDRSVAETNKGQIIFNPQEDLSVVAENIALLISEIKSKTPDVELEYLDARFGNKIFYKLR